MEQELQGNPKSKAAKKALKKIKKKTEQPFKAVHSICKHIIFK